MPGCPSAFHDAAKPALVDALAHRRATQVAVDGPTDTPTVDEGRSTLGPRESRLTRLRGAPQLRELGTPDTCCAGTLVGICEAIFVLNRTWRATFSNTREVPCQIGSSTGPPPCSVPMSVCTNDPDRSTRDRTAADRRATCLRQRLDTGTSHDGRRPSDSWPGHSLSSHFLGCGTASPRSRTDCCLSHVGRPTTCCHNDVSEQPQTRDLVRDSGLCPWLQRKPFGMATWPRSDGTIGTAPPTEQEGPDTSSVAGPELRSCAR